MDGRTDYTTGELAVLLNTILDNVKGIRTDMLTKSEFNTWREGLNERLVRLENDHKNWVKESTEAHVTIDRDSKARHAEALKQIEELGLRVDARLAKDLDEWKIRQEDRQDVIEDDQRRERSTKWLTWTVAIGSGVMGLLASLIVTYLTQNHG